MKTTTYTKEQVIDFINAQPDDRAINFGESWIHPEDDTSPKCGCLLVHMIQNTYPEKVKLHGAACAFAWAESYVGNYKIETPHINTHLMEEKQITTYGQLKQHIDQLFTE